MNWKTELQLVDLAPSQRLEVTCKECGHSRYESPTLLMSKMGLSFEYLDEVEHRLYCTRRGCNGAVRIALSTKGDTEGFVGGLA